MDALTKKALEGAVGGFLAAFIVDLNAWSKAPSGSPFDWGLAAKRWVAGAVAGATAALGFGSFAA